MKKTNSDTKQYKRYFFDVQDASFCLYEIVIPSKNFEVATIMAGYKVTDKINLEAESRWYHFGKICIDKDAMLTLHYKLKAHKFHASLETIAWLKKYYCMAIGSEKGEALFAELNLGLFIRQDPTVDAFTKVQAFNLKMLLNKCQHQAHESLQGLINHLFKRMKEIPTGFLLPKTTAQSWESRLPLKFNELDAIQAKAPSIEAEKYINIFESFDFFK